MNSTLKKFRLALCALLALACAPKIFAKPSGDLQLQLGWRGQNASFTMSAPYYNPDADFDARTNAFSFALSNWNLFALGERVSLGFMESFGGYVGGCGDLKIKENGQTITIDKGDAGGACGFDFAIGPAVAIRAGKGIEVRVAAAFALSFDRADILDRWSANAICHTTDALGLGARAEVQVKFLPEKLFSPLVGFRYAFTVSKTPFLSIDQIGSTKVAVFPDDFASHTFNAYVGASWNF